ncbi:hypothetical protein L3X38_043167 [Prunus dulcis]|uniref:Uncharacterized protein n=1 Tax=Prunus dulcis TaxID=3755 RepID=A0AAD4UXM8_PRUDU|nr:hypothetical protein L3X38_043167 [Prunus dulcis]
MSGRPKLQSRGNKPTTQPSEKKKRKQLEGSSSKFATQAVGWRHLSLNRLGPCCGKKMGKKATAAATQQPPPPLASLLPPATDVATATDHAGHPVSS